MFPEDLRDPESSTCDSDVSIPVETGRPLSFLHKRLDVKRERSIGAERIRSNLLPPFTFYFSHLIPQMLMILHRSMGCQTETKIRRERTPRWSTLSFPRDCQMRDLAIVQCYLTADFSIFPAENFGTLAAGIRRASPVLGFRPSRAFRLATVKVPKFTSETRCPFFRDVVTAPVKACSAVPAATFVIPADAAIFAISSSFVIVPLLVIELNYATPCHRRSSIPHVHESGIPGAFAETSDLSRLRGPIPFHENVQVMDLLSEGIAI